MTAKDSEKYISIPTSLGPAIRSSGLRNVDFIIRLRELDCLPDTLSEATILRLRNESAKMISQKNMEAVQFVLQNPPLPSRVPSDSKKRAEFKERKNNLNITLQEILNWLQNTGKTLYGFNYETLNNLLNYKNAKSWIAYMSKLLMNV